MGVSLTDIQMCECQDEDRYVCFASLYNTGMPSHADIDDAGGPCECSCHHEYEYDYEK